MTVQTTTNVATGIGNGVTTVFPVGYKFNQDADLVVFLIETSTSVATLQTLNSDYSVQGAGDDDGGSVTFTVNPPATGYSVKIVRMVDLLQLTDLRNQGKFFAEVHEDAFDLLTMMIQQVSGGIKDAMQLNEAGDQWVGRGVRLADIADPVEPQDAATRKWSEQYINSLLMTGQGPVNNASNVLYVGADSSLRVVQDISSDNPLLGAALVGWRRNKLLDEVHSVANSLNASAVNVWEFVDQIVSKPDPLDSTTWDWSPAVQAAIDFCHLSFPARPLAVSTLCRLASPVNIDRPIDGDAVRDTFVIYGQDGGGFIVDSAIPMFSTTIPQIALPDGNLAPSSQTIRLLNLTLTSTDASLAAYILDSNKFLRVWVDGCAISKLKMLASSSYVQTIYMAGNNIRYWQGFFFQATGGAYDIRAHAGNEIEQGEHFIQLTDSAELKSVSGCVIDGNVIEGLTGFGIIYAHTRSIAITNNYFEANASKDISGDDYPGFPNRGVVVSGNLFAQSAANKLNPAYRSVSWGTTDGGVSMGNFCDGNMHLTRTDSQVVFQDSALGVLVDDETRLDLSKFAFGTVSPAVNNTPYGGRAWKVGSVVFNLNPGGTLSAGWICAVAGTPGTWYAMGPLADATHWAMTDAIGGEHLAVNTTGNGANQTSLFVRYSNGSTDVLQRVVTGAADSAGTGFRTLRVPN